MIANGKKKTEGAKKIDVADIISTLKSLPSKIKTIHIVAVIGVFSIFVGYISVAPPTDLPNWPLYRLNAKVWQSFEHWGQHVKPYHIRLITTALQHVESRALYVMTYLEVPDVLHDSDTPLTCEEIKKQVDSRSGREEVNLAFLCRILHAASHFDLLYENSGHTYSLTPLSEYLVSSHPKTLRNFVNFYSGDEALIVSTALSRSIYTGDSGFKATYRTELLEHLPTDPIFQTFYDAGMVDGSRLFAPAIIADYPLFGSCKHICDIGGGMGSFLYEVLQYYSHGIVGTNFDLPSVIQESKYFLEKLPDGEKINLVAGNFTEKLPKLECDCYIMKDILQNWSDEEAGIILAHLYAVLGQGNRLLVIETMLHTGSYSEEKLKSMMDLTMMAFNPSHSRLRTQEEFYFLLEQSNFVDAQTYPTRAGYSIVEAFPLRS